MFEFGGWKIQEYNHDKFLLQRPGQCTKHEGRILRKYVVLLALKFLFELAKELDE